MMKLKTKKLKSGPPLHSQLTMKVVDLDSKKAETKSSNKKQQQNIERERNPIYQSHISTWNISDRLIRSLIN